MKLAIAFASIAALTILAPAAGFAAEPVPTDKTQPAGAAINTTRSNIKHPSEANQPVGPAPVAKDDANSALQDVSTTRKK